MQRTTIMLPESLKIKAMHIATQQGLSLGEFIRESLKNSCAAKNQLHQGRDPFFADNAIYDGKIPANLSSHHDDYLYEDQV